MTTETITISPPKPHSPKQAYLMQFFLQNDTREVWVPCGTKFGKSISLSAALANLVCSGRDGQKVRWLAPIFRQAEIGFDYMLQMLPPEPYINPTRGKMRIEIPDVKSAVQFLHSSRPVDLEGAGIHGYVFDEAAKMANLADVYASARSTTTFTQGKLAFISTPFGKNEFYKRAMEARDEMIWAHKKGIPPKKMFITARTIDNPHIDPAEVEAAKRSMPERLWRQLYLAEFVDSADVFAGFRSCLWTPPLEFENPSRQYWVTDDAADCEVVIGVDWAKTSDHTVMMAGDIETKKIIGYQRFNKIPYTEQIRMLCRFARTFGNVLDVWHDKTGLGQVIDDHLAHTGLPYRGVVFTNASKSEMVNGLITSFERKGKDIQIPAVDTLLSELDAFVVTANKLGTMSYGHPPGGHDDTVSALMLCNAALEHYAEREYQVRYIEDLKNETDLATAKAGTLEAYYSDLIADEDF